MTDKDSRELQAIADRLKELTEAIEEQNRLFKSCMLKPGEQSRILVGIAGAVETINL